MDDRPPAWSGVNVIPTRVKADSFWGFQSGASQIPWWRTGGSPCGQGLRFARTMTQPSFGAWRKRPGTRVKVGGCWRWPRSTMAALGPKPRRSAASGCRPSGTGWCGSTPAARCCRDPTGSTRGPIEVAGRPSVCPGMPALPFKLNQDRHRHIPEQKRKVTNWRDYDESLRRRGSLTVWFSDEAVAAWEAERRTSRGGQPEYSDLAILTALTFKAVFRLAYRQTEGLIGSVTGLLGLDLAVPDHTTLCRRAETLEVPRPKPRGDGAGGGAGGDTGPMPLLVDSAGLKLYGAGEWLVEKHGTKRRRSWRKLHLGVDAETGRIVAATLTDRDQDDASQVGPLLDPVAGPVASVTADGAYDQESVYADVAERQPGADVVVPPRSTAEPSATAETAPTQRDRHLHLIAEKGRMGWQKASGYNARPG